MCPRNAGRQKHRQVESDADASSLWGKRTRRWLVHQTLIRNQIQFNVVAGIEAVAEACLMQFNMSCIGYAIYHDDLSAAMQNFQKQYLKDRPEEAQDFVYAFLSDMYRILQLKIDYSGDIKIENYLKNALHQKTLSMQLSLGYHGEEQHRTLPSKIAFATLQLRWAALTFLTGLKQIPAGTAVSAEAELSRTGTRSPFRMTAVCSF